MFSSGPIIIRKFKPKEMTWTDDNLTFFERELKVILQSFGCSHIPTTEELKDCSKTLLTLARRELDIPEWQTGCTCGSAVALPNYLIKETDCYGNVVYSQVCKVSPQDKFLPLVDLDKLPDKLTVDAVIEQGRKFGRNPKKIEHKED